MGNGFREIAGWICPVDMRELQKSHSTAVRLLSVGDENGVACRPGFSSAIREVRKIEGNACVTESKKPTDGVMVPPPHARPRMGLLTMEGRRDYSSDRDRLNQLLSGSILDHRECVLCGLFGKRRILRNGRTSTPLVRCKSNSGPSLHSLALQ